MSTRLSLAPDTAIALGIASTAMPFARSPEAEAERWLRILRLHGEAGHTLSALGVTEAPLKAHGEEQAPPAAASENRTDTIEQVTDDAVEIACRRGARAVGTEDVLQAVMDVYGSDFDRVLEAHGTDRGEVLERLAADSRPHHG